MPVRSSSDEHIARDPETLASRGSDSNSANTNPSVLRASVLDAYTELGVLDEDSYIADWIFNDVTLTVEELEASHKNRVKFQRQNLATPTPAPGDHPDADVADEEEKNSSTFLRLLSLKKKDQRASRKMKKKKENHPPPSSTPSSAKTPSSPAPLSSRKKKKRADSSDTDEGYISSASRRTSSRFFHLRRKSKSSPEDQTSAPPATDPAVHLPKDKEAAPTQTPPPAEEPLETRNDKVAPASPTAAPPSAFPLATPASSPEKTRRRWSLFTSMPKSHKARDSSSASDASGQHSKSITASTEHGNDTVSAEPADSAAQAGVSEFGETHKNQEEAHEGDKWETLSKSDALSMDLLASTAIDHHQNQKQSSVFSRGKKRLSLQ